jgi:hypothetical protein
MDKETLRDRIRYNGCITVNYGRFLNFENFCEMPFIDDLIKEGVVTTRKNKWYNFLSSKETYIWIGNNAQRIYSDIDPYGEEIWEE